MIRIAIALALIGCTDNVQLDRQLGDLVSLDVSPGTTTLSITDLGQPAQSFAFTATGHFGNGATRDVTAYVQWTVDNSAPGGFTAPGTYTTSNAAGGHVVVTATGGRNVTGTAALTVVVSATIVDGAFPPPGDPGTLFPPGAPVVQGDPMHAPALSYPADATMFPQGLTRTLVQYTGGMQNDAFRLTFTNDVLHLTVYTGADRWSADGAVWSLIAASGVGVGVSLVVAGTSSTAGTGSIYGSAPVALGFSRDSPGGLIYYWSAATSGVMRGSLGASVAGKLYPQDATCVGCHAVTRDGRQLALGYGGEILQTVDIASLAPVIPASARLGMGWATYSPDGKRVLVANKGQLALYDAVNGAPVGSPDGHVKLPPNMFATHPDWSPDGTTVAIALTTMAPTNMDVRNASIALLAFANDSFGAPQVLVPAMGMDNDYFPRWSPNGRYLAFVHAMGTSHANPGAALRLVAASGGTPIALPLASPGLADSMPTWAPFVGDHEWLAFTSTRPYGAVLPTGGTGQIWIAALAPDGDGDPSSAAFWLPCQDVTALENNPVWAPEMLVTTPTSRVRTGSR
jgi:TolB protein